MALLATLARLEKGQSLHCDSHLEDIIDGRDKELSESCSGDAYNGGGDAERVHLKNSSKDHTQKRSANGGQDFLTNLFGFMIAKKRQSL
jgi:hypothetical protein